MKNDHTQNPDLDPDHETVVNNDPMSLPEEGIEKQTVSPDPQKVREAGREDSPFSKEQSSKGPMQIK